MEEEKHIGIEIKRLDNEIHSTMAAYRAEAGADDLTMMQSWIIGFLYRHGEVEIFQRDIEAEFSIARSTATGILQLMEKRGYIDRESMKNDGRMKKLVLTEEGVKMHKTIVSNIKRIESKLREGIPGEEIDIFFRVVQKMRLNVEQEHTETDRRRNRC